MTTPKNYEPVVCTHQQTGDHCLHCGCFLSASISAYKTNRYISTSAESNHRYLNSIRKKSKNMTILREKSDHSEVVYDFLQKISQKFEFTIETTALAIYLYNKLLNRSKKNQHSSQPQFYGSVCLMVAAKAIELDKHIPYFTRYQKYACKSHSKTDYEKAEKQIMQHFQFNLQMPTFVTFIHVYFSNGLVFSDEDFSKKKIFLVEQKLKELMVRELRTGNFVLYQQQKLAAALLLEVRKQFKLKSHPLIQLYTNMTTTGAEDTQLSILKPISINSKVNLAPIEHIPQMIKLDSRHSQNNSMVLGRQTTKDFTFTTTTANNNSKLVINKIRLNPLRTTLSSSHILNIVTLRRQP